METRFFKNGVGNSWEWNLMVGDYSVRIARHQLALWKNYNPIINIIN